MAETGEIEIPRSTPGDRGRYYLLEAVRDGDVVHTLYKRVGPSVTGYTRFDVDCTTRQHRDLGYSEESPEAIRPYEHPPDWSDFIEGSSKGDVVKFVCARK